MSEVTVEPGYCRCGCGEFVGFWPWNDHTNGYRKGDPKTFAKGHNVRAALPSPEVRFWERVDKGGPNGCWNWTGYRNKAGYGIFVIDGKPTRAHRFSFELAGKEIPEGYHMDHLCRNRGCVNHDHLEAVTLVENTMRGVSPAAINARRTHCHRGHPFDEANTYVSPSGGRACRTCRREWAQKRRAK